MQRLGRRKKQTLGVVEREEQVEKGVCGRRGGWQCPLWDETRVIHGLTKALLMK